MAAAIFKLSIRLMGIILLDFFWLMRRILLNKLELAVGPDTEPLSVRMFRLLSFITGVLCLFVFWPVNLFEPDVPQSANLVVIGVGVLALGIHWQSHKGRHLVAVLLAVIILALDYEWFSTGGFVGGTALYYPTTMALALILYAGWRRWLAAGLVVANFCMIWLLSALFPNWIIKLNDSAEVNLDIAVGVLMNCLTLAIILTIIIYNYHQERQSIAASEKKYRQLFENMTVGFALHEVICDASGKPVDFRYLAVNPAFEKLTGITPAVILGKTIREVKPDTEDYWIEVFGSVALTGVPRAYVNYSRELGRYYDTWTFQTGPGGFAVIFSDVTEKKLAEIKIQEQARLLDEAKDAIAVIGLDGKFTYVNEAWAQMHGWGKSELIGQHLASVHTPEQFKACEHINDDVTRLGRVQTETGHKRKDGSTFPVWLSVSEVRDPEGRLTGFLGIANDITEQKKITQSLIQARTFYQTLLATASDGIHILDRDGHLVEGSASFYRMLGHDPAHPPKLQVSDWDAQWSPPELSGRMLDHLREPSVFETIHRRANGDLFPVEVSVRGVFIDGRELIYGASRDITERKKAEAALRHYELALQQTNEGIAILGPDGRLQFANEAWAKMHGYEKAELLGRTLDTVHTPEQTRQCDAFQVRVLEQGHAQAELGHQRKDGSTFPVWMSVSVVRDAAGRFTGLMGIANDISARKVAEEKIREQARLIDETSESIVVRDLQGVILMWNRGAEKLLGWSATAAVGQLEWQLGKYAFKEFAAAQAQVIAQGDWSGDFAIKTRDDRLIEIESRWTLLRDDQGRPLKILSLSHDITSRKKMEAQLLRAERLQTIGTLASGVAHDLNNIFAPFLVGLPILRADIRTGETRELLDLMETSIRRGADIVRQLLLFGRGGETKRLPVNLARPLGDVAKIIRETFPRDIILSVVCPDDLWLVLGDATQIYQIFLNLAVNARDAMPHGGTLTITAENGRLDERIRTLSARANPGPYVVLTVRDTGIGMAPEVLERVFEPFYTTKETGKGTGLGLSVALGVVENHGGFIHVQSTPHAGTEFKLHLPALPEAAGAPAAKKLEKNVPPGRGEFVLLVDDEPAILKIAGKILELNGYQPLVAPNGAQALEVFRQNDPNIRLVITDYSMPGMNGFALAEALKKLNPGIQVIVSSGLGDALDEVKLRQAGIQLVLKKPYDTATLLATLENFFRPES